MKKTNCPCVLPSATEEEIATIPGERPGTAVRVRVEPGVNGYLRLEQLAYSVDLGWYAQKSFCVPGQLLAELLPQLRKAACYIPRRPHGDEEEAFMFPGLSPGTTPGVGPEATREAVKREA